MAEQQEQTSQGHETKHGAPPPGAKRVHRVCIQCNQMFPVTPENYDAKQCPECHKG